MDSGCPGPLNLITDVAGLRVGNAEDHEAISGVTVVLPDEPAVAAADIRGGAPGTREMDALDAAGHVEAIHGVVLSGGSVFGLEAASGVVQWLAERGVGFTFRAHHLPCPVVPAAILFDLGNGGAKTWGEMNAGAEPPYRALGRQACEAAGRQFALGNSGAGLGATAGIFKGGLGSASVVWRGVTVGALVAVNSFGSPADPLTGDLWAAPYAMAGEFPHGHSLAAGFRRPGSWTKAERVGVAEVGANTTIAVVATDADLSRAEARRLAIMAANGLARALNPVHTPFDGDSVIALATGRVGLEGPRAAALSGLGTLAADALARAIGRAIWQARAIPGWPAYRDRADQVP